MANLISVMVVDDDPVSSAQLGALAKAAGYEARSAPNGREAWELLQLARVPIVISDWYMPEMDGPELCRRIRARTHLEVFLRLYSNEDGFRHNAQQVLARLP